IWGEARSFSGGERIDSGNSSLSGRPDSSGTLPSSAAGSGLVWLMGGSAFSGSGVFGGGGGAQLCWKAIKIAGKNRNLFNVNFPSSVLAFIVNDVTQYNL